MKRKPIPNRRYHKEYDLDDILSETNGIPRGKELPQVETEEEIILSIYQSKTGMPLDRAYSVLHHQMTDDDF